MVVTRFLILAWLMCSLTSADAQKPSWEYGAAKLRGWQAQAIPVALREFQKHQGGKNERGEPGYGDLRHYAVYVSQSPPNEVPVREECVRVEFVPDSAPSAEAIPRNRCIVRGQPVLLRCVRADNNASGCEDCGGERPEA
jgi:hypothetical protein